LYADNKKEKREWREEKDLQNVFGRSWNFFTMWKNRECPSAMYLDKWKCKYEKIHINIWKWTYENKHMKNKHMKMSICNVYRHMKMHIINICTNKCLYVYTCVCVCVWKYINIIYRYVYVCAHKYMYLYISICIYM